MCARACVSGHVPCQDRIGAWPMRAISRFDERVTSMWTFKCARNAKFSRVPANINSHADIWRIAATFLMNNEGERRCAHSYAETLRTFIRRSLFGRDMNFRRHGDGSATFAKRNLLRNGIFLAHVRSGLISINPRFFVGREKKSTFPNNLKHVCKK